MMRGEMYRGYVCDHNTLKIKMKAILVHQGIFEELDATTLKELEDKRKIHEIESEAHNAILLSLSDKVL
uniref:Uncharacterized protein n=1 Tax=Cannabis sativa TaxID=3483 RepID=A0A803PUW4_CANSA